MTRKDYQLIASVLLAAPDKNMHVPQGYFMAAREKIARALADELERENPNFQYNRFLVACGVTP